MRAGLLLDRPLSNPLAPVINQFAAELARRNCEVICILPALDGIDLETLSDDCDFYVSKACSEPLLALTGVLHDRGARLFNSFEASSYLRDKARVTAALMAAGIPVPRSCIAGTAALARKNLGEGAIIVKPIRGTNGEGIAIARSSDDLSRIEGWPHFAQAYDHGSAEDIKVYVIGSDVFAIRGKAAVAGPLRPEDRRLCPVTREINGIALSIAGLFGLDVCGIDIVETQRGLAVVDVNSFPSFNGVPQAAERLADCILARAGRGHAGSTARSAEPGATLAPSPRDVNEDAAQDAQ